jgi:hypothetical protein
MTLPGQTSLPFDEPDDYEREPDPSCPACGDERPRFQGRKNRSDVYVCTNQGCQLLWESFRPGRRASTERCHLCHGPGTESPGTGPHFKRFNCSDERCGGWRWLPRPKCVGEVAS